jgi:hypothetical protein
MPLSTSQESALRAQSDANAEALENGTNAPATAEVGGQEATEDWLSLLRNLSDHLASSSVSHNNYATYSTQSPTMSKRVLASEGFSTSSKVFFTPAVAGSYQPWMSDTAREVKQIVLQSFGETWHAYQSSGTWKGEMNRTGNRELFTKLVTNTFLVQAWVPGGTQVDAGMAHPDRLAPSLQYLLNPTTKGTGANFIIDRKGNLFITGDANNNYNSSGSLSATCVSIALEEAMYLDVATTVDWIDATWNPGGDSTLQFWDYSPAQYSTLAVLIAKMQMAYPALAGNAYTTSKTADDSFTGVTLKSHISSMSDKVVDCATHFSSVKQWEALFKKVDDQKSYQMNFNVWKSNKSSYASYLSWVSEAIGYFGPDVLGLNKNSSNSAAHLITGVYRADAEANLDSAAYRFAAARGTSKESGNKLAMKNVGEILNQAATSPLVVPNLTDANNSDERIF